MNDNITKLNMVITTLQNNIEERNLANAVDKKNIAIAKKKIKALEKLQAKEQAILSDMFEGQTVCCDTYDDCGCTCEHEEIPVIY